MAYWIEDRKSISDDTRPGGTGEIIKFGCDSPADVSSLPGQDAKTNSKIRGSSVTVLSPAEVHKLGSGGWVKLG